MPRSGQIVNETTSRSGIRREHEQVSSYSYPNDNVLGIFLDSVNMTISLPEEKQLAIIQKANSLLSQNLISIGSKLIEQTLALPCQIASSSSAPISNSPINEKENQSSRFACVGNLLKSEGFLKGCPNYCFLPGDPVQRNITSQHGNHLIAGDLFLPCKYCVEIFN